MGGIVACVGWFLMPAWFTASGSINVSYTLHETSGADGRGTLNAPSDWPSDEAPPCALIGRFGTSGKPFFIGTSWSRVVRENDQGALFLGINDINTSDNWAPGYWCVVTHFRTE